MSKNSFFKHNKSEQSLIDDLTIETIKIHGEEMVYIPRTYVEIDDLFGEDILSSFNEGNIIEMYIDKVDGFGGEGDFVARFGLEIRDTVDLVVSKTRFAEVMSHDPEITRPREGDLIYFPLSKGLFEIKFVEHENPFYQLGSLYTYKLSCQLFKYSHEDINTGFSEVDDLEDTKSPHTTELVLGTQYSSTINFYEGETVFQIDGVTGGESADADSTAIVYKWDLATKTLTVYGIMGSISAGATADSIKGVDSGAEYEIESESITTDIIPMHDEDTDQGDNEDIERESEMEDIFDFSDTDPFSEGPF